MELYPIKKILKNLVPSNSKIFTSCFLLKLISRNLSQEDTLCNGAQFAPWKALLFGIMLFDLWKVLYSGIEGVLLVELFV